LESNGITGAFGAGGGAGYKWGDIVLRAFKNCIYLIHIVFI